MPCPLGEPGIIQNTASGPGDGGGLCGPPDSANSDTADLTTETSTPESGWSLPATDA